MLRYAIPEYRLPKEELRKEIRYIERLGVTIRCGTEVGKDVTLDTIKNDFDAIFVGTGAPQGITPWAWKGKTSPVLSMVFDFSVQ